MTVEQLTVAGLAVSLLGHLVHAGVFILHCRRDKREIRRLENRPEALR